MVNYAPFLHFRISGASGGFTPGPRVSGFFLVSRLIQMVGRRKLRFVNFGLRIILTFLKIQNGDPANTSQN